MKQYHSINHSIVPGMEYVVFDKYDGSNIRAEWSPKQGFYKFGSRNQLLTTEQVSLYPSIEIIKSLNEQVLSDRFSAKKFVRAICYFEYHGPNSFAGSHSDPVSDMRCTLIDIDVFKKGILPVEDYFRLADGLDTPKVVYRGRPHGDEQFFDEVKAGTLPGITFEGVVGKGAYSQKLGHPEMFKLKTRKWLDKLKEYCNGNEKMFAMLK